MNFNGSEVNESPCKYCKYDGYQNRLDSACYTCCFNGDSDMPSWFRNKEGATDMAKDLTIELHIDIDERCKESIDYFKSIRKTTDYLAFSIKRGIFWYIVLINCRMSTVLFFTRALSKRRVEDKLYNWCLCMKMNEVIEYEGKSF